MASKDARSGGLKTWFATRNPREQKMLLGLAVFFPLLALVVAVGLIQRSMSEIELETAEYKQSLDLVAAAAPSYLEAQQKGDDTGTHKQVTEETLTKNDIKLTSFVAEHAGAAKIDVTSYDEDQIPFGTQGKGDGGPIIVEKQLRVEIRSASMASLVDLLDRIEKSEKPVFIKRVDVRKHGKDPGQVRSVLTVSTFVRKAKEG